MNTYGLPSRAEATRALGSTVLIQKVSILYQIFILVRVLRSAIEYIQVLLCAVVGHHLLHTVDGIVLKYRGSSPPIRPRLRQATWTTARCEHTVVLKV